MRSKLMLSLTASAAVMLFHPLTQPVWAQDQAALTGTVRSDVEGSMEGVVGLKVFSAVDDPGAAPRADCRSQLTIFV
jgi:hypothetical protein